MVRGAADLIRKKGVSGTGLRQVVKHSKAPRGSLQHYFPGGKDQLVEEALLWMGSVAARHVRRFTHQANPRVPSALLALMVDEWRTLFLTAGYAPGCPLVAAAADVASTNDSLRETIKRAFDEWLEPVAAALVEMGVPAARSASLAVLTISALEGSIVLSRTRRDITPLDVLVKEVGPILDSAVSTRRRRPDRKFTGGSQSRRAI